MPMPGYMEIKDSGGSLIESGGKVQGRENWIEVIEFDHQVSLPTDSLQGKIAGARQHSPLSIVKEFDKASVKLYEALSKGEKLKEVIIHWYRIDDTGQEVEYFRHTITDVKLISIEPVMYNVYDPRFESYRHLEKLAFRYEIINWWHESNMEYEDQWNVRDGR